LAIKPQDNETFLREVDEELRKEQMNNFVARYGWALIIGAVLLIAAIGGWIWWQNQREAQAAAKGEALLEAMESYDAGNRDAAAQRIADLADSGNAAYRAAALFTRAGAQVEAGQLPAAIATYRSIAEDGKLAEPYRQVALIRQTALEFDTIDPGEVIRRLGPLAQAGQPFLGSAGELVAVAHMKQNRPERAAPIFQAIARDESVPDSIRTRAVQMAGALGVDATDQAAAAPGAEAGAGNAAAARE
jgi:hypothetical protein